MSQNTKVDETPSYRAMNFHPASMLVYMACVLFLLLFSSSSIAANSVFEVAGSFTIFHLLLCMVALTVSLLVYAGAKVVFKLYIYGFFITIFTTFITTFSYHEGSHIFLYVDDSPLTLEALFSGISTGLLMLSMLIAFRLFYHLMNSAAFVYIVGKVFPTIALMINMIFTFINRYKRNLNDINSAQESLGISTKSGSLMKRLRHGAVIFSALISYMFENSLDTAASMNARGYMHRKRFQSLGYSPYHMHLADFVLLALSMIYIIVFVAAGSLLPIVAYAFLILFFMLIPIMIKKKEWTL